MKRAGLHFGKVYDWLLKLPNSGKTLKLRVLSNSLKAIDRWFRKPSKVTTSKICENNIGNRGSKSDFKSVKEQRVDGSLILKKNKRPVPVLRSLRCTLKDFKRNYHVGNPTKNSTDSSPQTLHPKFITGFADAEGCFMVGIFKSSSNVLGWRVSLSFAIHIHIKDISLLYKIKNTLGVGVVRRNSTTTAIYSVTGLSNLKVIINHFIKYPLISEKYADFILFKYCYDICVSGAHLTLNGFRKILSFKSSLNKGLSSTLIVAFPGIIPEPRPVNLPISKLDPNWIAGFISGDSSFSVAIENVSTGLGKRVRLIFGTCLHIRDYPLLLLIRNHFIDSKNISSNIHCSKKNNTSILQIKDTKVIFNKVIPFFNKYPVEGIKALDFNDFQEVAKLMGDKQHLTPPGLDRIIKIANGMNLNRKL